MSSAAAELVDLARDVYGGDDECAARLDAQSARLREPLRVALVGPAASGKSTLIGALLGEDGGRTAPPRSTRLVTWFRYGERPRTRVRLEHGVRQLEVERPVELLRDLTLIDTPGDAGLPVAGPPVADVILHVRRDTDPFPGELPRAHRAASGPTRGVSAVVVLGRADEAGTGGIESLLTARSLAARWADDPGVRPLVVATVAVSGLLARGARALRETDLAGLTRVAALGRVQRERATASVEAFTARGPELDLTRAQRTELLHRFGLHGVRLGAVLLAGGMTGAADLGRELARQSGIDDLDSILEGLRSRAGILTADAALAVVGAIVREYPRREGTSQVESAMERMVASAHELRELRTLASLSTSALPSDLRVDATRLLGGRGTSPAHRLNIAEPIALEHLVLRARDEVSRWRALAEHGGSDPEVARIARVVVRSAEGMLDQLAG